VYVCCTISTILIIIIIAFWKTWRSKFNNSARCGQVDGCVDADAIAEKIVSHFRKAFTCNNFKTAESLKTEYFCQDPSGPIRGTAVF